MKKFSLILFSLFSMLKSVSADNFYDFYKLNINFGFIHDVELWVFMITWGILFLLVNGIAKKLHFFRDDIKNAAIFSVLVSIAAMVGSPVSTLMMATVIVSPIIIFFLFFIILIWTAISYFLLGSANAANTRGRATSQFRSLRRSFGQIRRLSNRAMNLIRSIRNSLNHIADPSEGSYDSESREVVDALRELIAELDKMRQRIDEEDPEGKSNSGDQIRKAIDEAENSITELGRGNVDSAKKDVRNAEKKISIAMRKNKRLLKEAKKDLGSAKKEGKEDVKLLQEGKGDSSKIIEKAKKDYSGVLDGLKKGKYDQEQASGWQIKIWEEFTRDLRKQGYGDDQIKGLWEKEIWSLGHVEKTAEEAQQPGQNNEWKKFIEKKIDRINRLFKVNLAKHPKKAQNLLKKIRDDIGDDMLSLAESLGQKDNMDGYSTQFDQILEFFDHNKKPNEANQKDWESIMSTATAYKNFLLGLRDKL